ncbi:hypothetical protein PIIN_08555 [Serendipita indica DSM 11827]|uniref:Uncharacterized protein n=1 Tax=Serendipita indica (strain DSM 11827) TaxID=1109443 RepID=G4TTG0_SERID|nr:hypothetical protein PIIN_08555 [Serendipita indica DSM 11827]
MPFQDSSDLDPYQCFNCINPYSREIHTYRNGANHEFALTRLQRTCRHCRSPITRNCVMCTRCTDDNSIPSFALNLSSSLSQADQATTAGTCLKCAEDGKGRRHIRQHPHDMVLFVLEVGGVLPEGVNAFVSGSPDIAENNDILERSEDPPPYVA